MKNSLKSILSFIVVVLIIAACNSGNTNNQNVNTGGIPSQNHEVTVLEVVHASSYTYLRVSEGEENNIWLAVNRMEAEPGQIFYYTDALEMTNFQSKELNKTFSTIYFIQDIYTEPVGSGEVPEAHKTAAPVTQEEISVEPAEGAITISELFANKADYEGKTVTVTGKVTKVNLDIMGKNWAHIQDGTSHEGDFDLTVTTADLPAVDDVVTFEGEIYLDKDFGAGYVYEVIMENARVVEVR